MLDSDFTQIAAILLIAAAVGGLASLLKQPLIVAYIAVGVIVGPPVLGLVTATEQVSLLAEVGIAILLFLVGLKLDLHLIRETGPVALLTGLGQVLLTAVLGFAICTALGLEPVPAAYVAVALTFSSTIVVVKLLSDKRELDELHGRIAVGVLIVQDLVVILAMIVITAIGSGQEGAFGSQIARTALTGVTFLAGVALLARWVIPPVLDRVARSPELLVLFGVAWAVAVAAFSDAIGLTLEVGAFLAGVSLASTAYREALGARLVTLRDVLIVFFFIDLGTTMNLDDALDALVPALVLSAFVLLGKPLIVMLIMGVLGYRKRVSALTGLTLAQISEFSLILTALGVSLGHVGESTMAIVTVVAIITIGLSTYLVLDSKQIYERVAPALSVFERRSATKDEGADSGGEPHDAIVIGGGRFGTPVVEGLRERGARVLVVDFDPHALSQCAARGADVLYGDITEPELVSSLPLHEVRTVISTVPERSANVVVLHGLRRAGFEGRVMLTARTWHDAELLEQEEGVIVLRPFLDAANRVLPRLDADGEAKGGMPRGDAGTAGP